MSGKFSLTKEERLSGKKAIDHLFTNGDSILVYPFRIAFVRIEKTQQSLPSILISVAKKRFKKAVWRNKIRRRSKEAYRLNKAILTDALQSKEYTLQIAFVYIDKEIKPFSYLNERMVKLLKQLTEKLP